MPGLFCWPSLGNNRKMRTIRLVLRMFVVTGLAMAACLALAADTPLPPPATLGELAQGAYFGVLLLLLVATMGQALAHRDRNFSAFALYLLLLGAAQAVTLGLAGAWLWPDDPDWNALTRRVAPGVAVVAALWLVKVLTEPARFSRALDLACWSFIAAL
ncbi:MAG: 7TM diverse intracellular signaling domain-containing protein, partial [Limnohabitans sp.]